jgi:hypothetical protein
MSIGCSTDPLHQWDGSPALTRLSAPASNSDSKPTLPAPPTARPFSVPQEHEIKKQLYRLWSSVEDIAKLLAQLTSSPDWLELLQDLATDSREEMETLEADIDSLPTP